ncbi:FAD-dependent monooxygenase [Streptomyces sp. NPDC005876]|uniref:FAD-dependent monooxygenase n=1 Tax=Streptomyces sp. NPDC005876 TaxID=3157076 RepID=UPI0033DC3CFA
MRIVIVGGGISGLVTALSLRAVGLEAVVLERAGTLEPVGLGINLLPSAVRELSELGLGDALEEASVTPHRLAYCDRAGSPLWHENLGRPAGFRWPQCSVHRGVLQALLLRQVERRIPGAVRTGVSLLGFETDGTGVDVHVYDRAADRNVTYRADVLIGADGIDSQVRARLYPAEGPALWNGVHMWRGLSTGVDLLDGRTVVVAGGTPGAKFIAYPVLAPVRPGDASRLGPALNWVLETRPPAPAHEDLLVRRMTVGDLRDRLKGWNVGFLDMDALLAGAAGITRFPMLDRDPLPRWSFGPVTLLGDAAHPMYPMGMNGGTQSVIDARVVAHCLARATDPRRALHDYETIRRPRLNRLVRANRLLGPERIIKLVEQRGGGSAPERLDRIADHYKSLTRALPADVNNAPSWSRPGPEPLAADQS